MKKFLLLLSVAMLSIGAYAAKSVHLKSKGQWAEYILSDKLPVSAEDYVSVKVTIDNASGKFQIKVTSEDIADNDYDSPAYVPFEDNVATLNFQEWLTSKGFTGKINHVNLQACDAEGQEVDLLEVIFVKADGTEEVQELGGDAWGGGAYEATELEYQGGSETPGEEVEEPTGEKNYIVKDDVEGAQKLIGWGGSMAISIVENEDGHNYEINNPETAENNWNIQVAYDVEDAYEVGTTYYLEYDIKGSVAGKTFAAGLQRTSDYAGCGDFGSVDVTTEWKHVKLSAKCSTEGATRLVISVGDYAGVLSLDNVEVYTLVEGGDTAINNIASEVTTDGAMYDLSGRRVVKAEGIVVKNGKIMLVK